ncbi:hypothetical protein EMIHUDRAFT_414703, partial [Emiliania huxleyi CCMP1516]|uniref:monogalactosyldiacylglycerol synthase n=2 Tax=Emiliania huxleyi TaxID=2903 RepID=A0A0D3IDN8_EMIH1
MLSLPSLLLLSSHGSSAATSHGSSAAAAAPPHALHPLLTSLRSVRERLTRRRKKRILILISDTGGGHRASAQALAGLIGRQHGESIEVSIVDVWTNYAPYPFNRMVSQYRYMQSRPLLWGTMYRTSAFPPTRFLFNSAQRLLAKSGIRACIAQHEPDLVISMHPLCQTVPLQALASLAHDGPSPSSVAGGEARGRVPFVTVVTDLGAAHPLWLHPGVDLCFVPSSSFVRAAKSKGLTDAQLRLHGLPVRHDFAVQRRRGAAARRELGLHADRKTVLVVGGGDGSAASSEVSAAILDCHADLGKRGEPVQLVVICGRNARLQQQLRETEWAPSIHVVVEGFVTRMSEFMAAADCLITKAGPGTIAEASICGLPVMLSGRAASLGPHLPGQETGNVRHVLSNGFGAYSRNPRTIAATVSRWLSSPSELQTLSRNARAASRPGATADIVRDVLRLLEDR